jgi:hypothetical protein
LSSVLHADLMKLTPSAFASPLNSGEAVPVSSALRTAAAQ